MLTISRVSDSPRPVPVSLLATLLIGILVSETALALQNPGRATLLALDNCESNDEQGTSPRRDAILLLNSRGQLIRQIPRLTIARGFGGCRGISVSPDGRFFVVCDYSEGLNMYRISSGTKVWSLSGFFRSAVFTDGLVYALGPHGIYAIDHEGTIVKHSRIGGGIDIAFDSLDKSLWIVGTDIKRYTLDMRLLFQVKLPFSSLNAGAFSVDLNPDGSVWVAGKNAYQREGGGNRLVKVSPAGEILKVINLAFCPQRVRVDQSDGSVWTTGRVRRQDFSRIGDEWPETVDVLDEMIEVRVESYTQKYDSEGNLLVNSTQGGTSIEVDPSDGSVWVADGKSILHCSSTGARLATYTGVSGSQKWLAIVP